MVLGKRSLTYEYVNDLTVLVGKSKYKDSWQYYCKGKRDGD